MIYVNLFQLIDKSVHYWGEFSEERDCVMCWEKIRCMQTVAIKAGWLYLWHMHMMLLLIQKLIHHHWFSHMWDSRTGKNKKLNSSCRSFNLVFLFLISGHNHFFPCPKSPTKSLVLRAQTVLVSEPWNYFKNMWSNYSEISPTVSQHFKSNLHLLNLNLSISLFQCLILVKIT